MLVVNREATPTPAERVTTRAAGNAVRGLVDMIEAITRNTSPGDWPALSSMLQREFDFQPARVTNTPEPEPEEDNSSLMPMTEEIWNSRYRNRSFSVSKAVYMGLVVSDYIIDNLKADTNHTYNQLTFHARRRATSRFEHLYGSNDQEDLARIEMLRLFELMIRDARFYFDSLTYIEQEYIPPLSTPGFTSGLRAINLIDFLSLLLSEVDYEKSDYISPELRDQMSLLLCALLDTKAELLAKLSSMELDNNGFDLQTILESYRNGLDLDATVPDGFMDYLTTAREEQTWSVFIAGRMPYFDMSQNARYYDEFDLFRRDLALDDWDDVEEPTRPVPGPVAVNPHTLTPSREVTPILGAIPATPLAPENQTRWELLTRDGIGFVGVRVNGVTLETLSSVRAYSESGGLTKLSLEVYIIPGRSTLTFSSQLSDTIRDTEGNAPPVAGGSVHDRFMDL